MRSITLKLLISVFLLLGAGCTKDQKPVAKIDPSNTEMDIFLLIGQSNMQGVAPIGSLDTIQLNNVFLFNDKNHWETARNLPDNGMNRYSTVKISPKVLFGPAYTFGRKIQAYTGHTIGIVSNARGSTRIEWWQKGFTGDKTYNAPSDFDLYEEAVARTKAALVSNPNARLKGVLWHQGEADNAISRSPLYMERLQALVKDLRADFGDPNLPFIAGEVGTWNGRGTNVNPVIRDIKNKIPFTEWVSSSGYTSIDLANNNAHFDNPSQRSFGGRYADKTAELVYHINPKGVTLYNGRNYQARSLLLIPGRYDYVYLEGMGLTHKEIQSIDIDEGYEIMLVTKSDKRVLDTDEPTFTSFVPEYIVITKR